MYCMNCGQQLPDGAKFCLNCGTPLGSTSSQTMPVNDGTFVPSDSQNINATAKPSFVPAMCPNCNAPLRVDASNKTARCEACGTEFLVQEAINKYNISGSIDLVHSGNVVHSGTVTYINSNEPNLYVSYTSVEPSLSMTIEIPELKITSIFNSGMNRSFRIIPGYHRLKIRFGTILWVNEITSRMITINEGTATRVDIGWQGGRGIFAKYYVNIM